jgi:DinB superfamily
MAQTVSITSYAQFLNDFHQTIRSATARLNAISAEQSCEQVADGWSRKETLGHLIDSATNNHHRFVLAQFTDDLVFPGYEQDGWVSAQKYRDESWPELIQLWSSYNLHLLHLVSVIPTDVLTKSRPKHSLDQIAFNLVPQSEPATLEYLIRDYADHLRHHLNQIFGETS